MERSNPGPAVSVIIPTLDRPSLLEKAVASVLAQTFDDLECIVVDDGCGEEARKRLAELVSRDGRLHSVAHASARGAAAARNTGLGRAGGRLIAFLDDDDSWLPDKLAKQVPLLDSLPERYGLVYCWMDYFDEHGRCIHRHHPTLRGRVFDQLLDEQRLGGCPTLLLRRSVVEAVGGFDERLRRGNDGDFIRRVCHRFEADLVPEVLVHVDASDDRPRISGPTTESIRHGIVSHRSKLEKFPDELARLPHPHADIHAQIGAFQLELGQPRDALRSFARAVRICPSHTATLRHLARGLVRRVRRASA